MKVTRHAIDRGDARLKLRASSFEALAGKALADGVKPADCAGAIARYLDKLFLSHGTANNLRLFAYQVFVFCDDRLVTVFPIPGQFRTTFGRIRDRKKQEAARA